LLFDRAGRPKPAFDTVMAALLEKSSASPASKSSNAEPQ